MLASLNFQFTVGRHCHGGSGGGNGSGSVGLFERGRWEWLNRRMRGYSDFAEVPWRIVDGGVPIPWVPATVVRDGRDDRGRSVETSA